MYEQNQRSIRQVNDNSQKYQQKIIKLQKYKGISSNPKVYLTSNRVSEKK